MNSRNGCDGGCGPRCGSTGSVGVGDMRSCASGVLAWTWLLLQPGAPTARGTWHTRPLSPLLCPTLTSTRWACLSSSIGLSSTHRTAGCGPACPVVWQGCAGNRAPYADYSTRAVPSPPVLSGLKSPWQQERSSPTALAATAGDQWALSSAPQTRP